MKIVRSIEMCLNDTYSRVCICQNLTENFHICIDLNKEMLYHQCSLAYFRICY
jgi:hypothetical protein